MLMAWSTDGHRACHGAHCGEGPVLGILAMLARRAVLRVAPGDSTPPISAVARRGPGVANPCLPPAKINPRYQYITLRPPTEWHDNRVVEGSDGEFPGPSWRRVDFQRVVNPAQGRFGCGRLADMRSASVTLAERRGDPLLYRKDLAQPCPGHVFSGRRQFTPDRLHN